MVCIYCGSDTEIYNSRPKARQPLVWRRRRCKQCVAQFTTHELPEYATALIVRRGKVLVPFERDKLFLSIYAACSHRTDAQMAASSLTATVIGVITRKKLASDGGLTTEIIAAQAFVALKRFDKSAGAVYKAHHQSTLR